LDLPKHRPQSPLQSRNPISSALYTLTPRSSSKNLVTSAKMGSVVYDSELMTNYVAGVPVPGGSHFATCLDPVSRKVVVFALSNDETPKLQMIKVSMNSFFRPTANCAPTNDSCRKMATASGRCTTSRKPLESQKSRLSRRSKFSRGLICPCIWRSLPSMTSSSPT